jgi:sulfhydrogenase subunit delta
MLKRDEKIKSMDVAFVEGAISSKKEEKQLREIRDNAKHLVAIGSCAAEGTPSNQRNFFDKKTMNEISFLLKKFRLNEKVYPLKNFVAVDDVVPGCPMIEEKFIQTMERYMRL